MTEVPVTTAAAQEIKSVLGGKLGATLVESSDPLWKRDPDIEQMAVDYRVALARLVPVFMPDILFRLTADGQPVFKEFAAAVRPTEFEPGKVFGSGKMKPIDYMRQNCTTFGRPRARYVMAPTNSRTRTRCPVSSMTSRRAPATGLSSRLSLPRGNTQSSSFARCTIAMSGRAPLRTTMPPAA